MLPGKIQRRYINLFLGSSFQRSSSSSSLVTLKGKPCYSPPPSASFFRSRSSTAASRLKENGVSVRTETKEIPRDGHQVITSIFPLPPDMNSYSLRNFFWSNSINVLDARKSTGEVSGLIQTSQEDQQKLLSSIHDIQAHWGNLTAVPASPAMTAIVPSPKQERKFLEALSTSKRGQNPRVVSSSAQVGLANKYESRDISRSDSRILFLSSIPELVTMQISFSKKFPRKHIANDLRELLLREGWAVPSIAMLNQQILVDIGGISVYELKKMVMRVQPELQSDMLDIAPLYWMSSSSDKNANRNCLSGRTLLISSLSPAMSCQDIMLYIRTLIPDIHPNSINRIRKKIGECTAVIPVQDRETLQSILGLHGRCFGGRPVNIRVIPAKTDSSDIIGLEHEKWNTFRVHNLPSNIQKDQIDSCLDSLGGMPPMKLLRWESNRTAIFSLSNPSEESRESIKRVHGNSIHGKTITIEILPQDLRSSTKGALAVEDVSIQQSPTHDGDYRENVPKDTGRLVDELSYLKSLFASYAPQYLQLYVMSQAKFQRSFLKGISQGTITNTKQMYKSDEQDHQTTKRLLIESDLLSVREILYHPNCGLFTPTSFDFDRRYSPPYLTECAKMFYKEVRGYPDGSLMQGLRSKSELSARSMDVSEWTVKFGRIVQDLVQSGVSDSYSVPVVKDLEKQIANYSTSIRTHIDDARDLLMVVSYIKYCRAVYYQSHQVDGQKPMNVFNDLVQGFDRRFEAHKKNLKGLQKLRNNIDRGLIRHGLQPCVDFLHMLVSTRARAEYVEGLLEIVRHPTHGFNGAFPFDGEVIPNPPYATTLARTFGSLIKANWQQRSKTHKVTASKMRLQSVLRTTDIQKLAPIYVPSLLSSFVRSEQIKAGRLMENPPKRMTVQVNESVVKPTRAVAKLRKNKGKT
ncbi:hypothetical protein [Phaffia rhodozyma]|uniref:RRM domain-containing protein n=1 Tax=Phaffia rhodozyma TaxID=264483 RepID=A0A0F7SP77_PHARH|nr:hypothetical protein [Phaffia rhodozyma]